MDDVIMPALGMAMTEGMLTRWLKNPGDPVEVGESVAEVETDKATMELESEASGRLGEHLFHAGDLVPVGVVITRVLHKSEDQIGASSSLEVVPTTDSGSRSPRDGETSALAVITIPDRAIYRQQATLLEGRQAAEVQDIDLRGVVVEEILEWLETMMMIRKFEQTSDKLSWKGKIPGGMHSAAGQEAVAVGAIRALTPSDIVTSSHRSHHHSLAKGLPPRSIMAELYGKATGCLGGRGGHMHLADFSLGLFGSNGIVGGGLGIAMGAALAAKMRGRDQVALGFFGDGGANTGRVWEFINLASVWKLPLIVVCENNLYAVETHVARTTASETIAGRASGFGLPAIQVDGQDVAAMYREVRAARERAVRGGGPTFIEALTYRYEGHNTGDQGTYRTSDEVAEWRATKDPIVRLIQCLERAGLLTDEQRETLEQRVNVVVAEAVEFAEQSPWPEPETAAEGVTELEAQVMRNV